MSHRERIEACVFSEMVKAAVSNSAIFAENDSSEDMKAYNRMGLKGLVGMLGTLGTGALIGTAIAKGRGRNLGSGAGLGALGGAAASIGSSLAGSISDFNSSDLKKRLKHENQAYIPLLGEYRLGQASAVAQNRAISNLLK